MDNQVLMLTRVRAISDVDDIPGGQLTAAHNVHVLLRLLWRRKLIARNIKVQ